MHQDRISESSNMLHYSNASSIEKNRRYLVIKGGLAWLLRQEGGVIGDVVDHRGISIVTGSTEEKRGGENSKYIASKCITGQQAELDVF